jgi:hypothetical protein
VLGVVDTRSMDQQRSQHSLGLRTERQGFSCIEGKERYCSLMGSRVSVYLLLTLNRHHDWMFEVPCSRLRSWPVFNKSCCMEYDPG